MKIIRTNRIDNKGFTLVELIVVIIILSILASILIPALLGYIDDAKSKQYLLNAKAFMNAAQSELIKKYSKNITIIPDKPVISGAKYTSNGGNMDQDISNTDFAANVLKLSGVETQPFFLMIGIGSTCTKSNKGNKDIKNSLKVTEHDKFTVYYVLYQETLDSEPWYFNDGDWSTINPRYRNTTTEMSDDNVIQNGKFSGLRIQYYILSDRTKWSGSSLNKTEFWDWIKGNKTYDGKTIK